MDCFNKECIAHSKQNKDNCTIRDQTKLCILFKPLTTKKDDGSKVPCGVGLSLLANKSKACRDKIKRLIAEKNKTVFHSNAIMAQQIRIMVIEEIVAELAKQFCEENNLADPKDDYHTRLIHPKGEIAIEGRGKNEGD